MLGKITKKSITKIAQINENNESPILFWDTCALLDILRLPFRKTSEKPLEQYENVNKLISENNLISVASELTVKELHHNLETVLKEYDKNLNKLQKDLENHEKYLIKSNCINENILTFKLEEKGLKQYLFDLFNKIIENTAFISEKNIFNKNAHFRVSHHMPPAYRKGEYKDCYIWTTCLELSNITEEKVLFFTTNTEDFYNNRKLLPTIQRDCDNNGINVICEIGKIYGTILEYYAP